MQETTTLLSIIQERGARGLPLQHVYRMLYNRNLYLTAYGNLYRNQGAMTKGTTDETVDGMSLEKIERIIAMVRAERYRWKPVRRVSIPKPNGKTRPLGLPHPGGETSYQDDRHGGSIPCDDHWTRRDKPRRSASMQ